MVSVFADRDELSKHQVAIEQIAREVRLPFEDVVGIYQGELTRLSAEARIKDFLAVLTSRRVRDVLRRDKRASLKAS